MPHKVKSLEIWVTQMRQDNQEKNTHFELKMNQESTNFLNPPSNASQLHKSLFLPLSITQEEIKGS